MATSYEEGENVSSERVAELSQARRNNLAKSSLALFLQELFVWHEIQTDPNFGNYRIRIGEESGKDRIVLLDFGAVQKYPQQFINPVCQMISAAYEADLEGVIRGGIALKFMQADWPRKILEEFAGVCIAVLEPLAKDQSAAGSESFNEQGEYRWRDSDLPSRIAKRAAVSAIAVSLAQRKTSQATLVRKLSGYKHNHPLLEALTEYNRLLKAQYLLNYIDDASLRNHVQRALNRGEAYHQLRRAISNVNGDRFRGNSDEEII